MAKTKNEVRDRAASDYLGVLQLGQSLRAQDDARISAAYDEVYQQLKKDGLATWPSTGSVPAEIVPHMVSLVAQQCVGVYTLSPARQQILLGVAGINGELAKREIRKLVSPDYSSQENAVDY